MDTNVSTRERFARIASQKVAEPSRPDETFSANPSSRLDHWLVARALAALGHPPLTVVLWDGCEIGPSTSGPNSRLIIRDRPALWRLVWDPWFYFGELYAAGRLEVPD